jgi:hypothetical protein
MQLAEQRGEKQIYILLKHEQFHVLSLKGTSGREPISCSLKAKPKDAIWFAMRMRSIRHNAWNEYYSISRAQIAKVSCACEAEKAHCVSLRACMNSCKNAK